MKHVFQCCTALILLSIVLYPIQKEVTFESNYKGDIVSFFTYIAKPENFKKLNPTIIDLKTVECHPKEFTVVYTEHLVQLSFIKNYARAEYYIYDSGTVWQIHSTHITCFYVPFLCLPTESIQSVTPLLSNKVHYQEDITYTCPWIFQFFCKEEVSQQRALIMKNLERLFS